jgi:hypothetical protein
MSMRKQEAEPEIVSQVIQEAMESPKPRMRYHAGIPLSGEIVLHLGDSVWQAALARIFKVQHPSDN